MAIKQFSKYVKKVDIPRSVVLVEEDNAPKVICKKNKKNKKQEDMTLNEIENAENILQNINKSEPKVKIIKKEKGLIERTETEKVVLTEDNRQVLND